MGFRILLLIDQFKYLNVLLFDLLLNCVVQISIRSSKTLPRNEPNRPRVLPLNDSKRLSRSKSKAKLKSRRLDKKLPLLRRYSRKPKNNQRAVKRIPTPKQINLPVI